ncbi:cohesin domain-containing protein, partial [Clostridium paraputrificum]|uniref:cohesin domain-containing protein n=1 Tax=Clostridium paraputrificum TaxID=29363 RepID=UPI003D3460A0
MNIVINKIITKLLSFFLSIFMLTGLCLSYIPVSATEVKPSINFTIIGEPTVGNIVDIAVNVSNISKLYGASIDFNYDTNLIEIKNIELGSLFNGNDPIIEKTENGQASIAISLSGDKVGVNGNGTLAIIKTTLKKAGTINFKTTNDYTQLGKNGFTTAIKLSDSNSNQITYTVEDNSLTIRNNQQKDLDAQVISENIPTSMEAGKTYPVSITVKNTG